MMKDFFKLQLSKPYSFLFHPIIMGTDREIVLPFRRLLIIPLLVLVFITGIGPLFDPGGYGAPVFDTFRAVAPLTWWGFMFLLASANLFYAAISGRVGYYIGAHAFTLFLTSFWALTLGWGKFVDNLSISFPAFGLWLSPLIMCVIVLTYPITVVVMEKENFVGKNSV